MDCLKCQYRPLKSRPLHVFWLFRLLWPPNGLQTASIWPPMTSNDLRLFDKCSHFQLPSHSIPCYSYSQNVPFFDSPPPPYFTFVSGRHVGSWCTTCPLAKIPKHHSTQTNFHQQNTTIAFLCKHANMILERVRHIRQRRNSGNLALGSMNKKTRDMKDFS